MSPALSIAQSHSHSFVQRWPGQPRLGQAGPEPRERVRRVKLSPLGKARLAQRVATPAAAASSSSSFSLSSFLFHAAPTVITLTAAAAAATAAAAAGGNGRLRVAVAEAARRTTVAGAHHGPCPATAALHTVMRQGTFLAARIVLGGNEIGRSPQPGRGARKGGRTGGAGCPKAAVMHHYREEASLGFRGYDEFQEVLLGNREETGS